MSSIFQLATLPQFRGVPLASVQDLARRAPVRSFEAGEVLFRQGEPADTAWLVVSGCFLARVEGEGGSREVGRCWPGEIVGEAALFLPAGRRSATLEAVEAASCLGLTPAVVDGDAEHPALIAIEAWLLRSMAHRLRSTSQAMQRGWSAAPESASRAPEPEDAGDEEERAALRRGPGSRRALLRELLGLGRP